MYELLQEPRRASPESLAAAYVTLVDVDRLRFYEEHPGFDDDETPRHLQVVGTDYEGELYLAAFLFDDAEDPNFLASLSIERADAFFDLYLRLWEYIVEESHPAWMMDTDVN